MSSLCSKEGILSSSAILIIDSELEGFFSVITEAELLSGVRAAQDEASIYDVLNLMEAIEVRRDIAITAGKLRRKYYAAYKAA